MFLDEGGNFDFSSTGTRYFTLSSISVKRPFNPINELSEYRYDLIEYGLNQEYFHCCDDNRHVRNRVFDIIESHLDDIRIDSLIIEKRKTGPALQLESNFYPKMLGYLLRYVIDHVDGSHIDEVVVITDNLPVNRKRKAIEKATKTVLHDMLPAESKYRLLHHSSKSHVVLQIADYCNWAILRKWERDDMEFYNKISPAISSEYEIFRKGQRFYY